MDIVMNHESTRQNGFGKFVKELSEKDAGMSILNNKCDNALSLACKKGHTDIVNLLLKKYANDDSRDTYQFYF